MQAYIQQKTKNWLNKETALEGLSALGHIVSLVEDVPEVVEDAIFYGNVGFIRNVVAKLGYSQRFIGHVPDELHSLAGRYIKTVTMQEALAKSKEEQIFIKPIPEHNKQFNGFVLNNNQMDSLYYINYLMNFSDLVLMSPMIDIVSEWRCFVMKGECLDGKRYKGDFKIFPNYDIVEQAIKLWTDAPAAWSCDLGITNKGETVIVECNDVMSLGFYALSPIMAGAMLEKDGQKFIKTNHYKFMKAQLYTIKLAEPIAEIGQLVFAGNESNDVVGIIVAHKNKKLEATIMLFEPKDIKTYIKILKPVLTEEQIAKYFQKCENKWPGYINWFTSMDTNDWQRGCPIGQK